MLTINKKSLLCIVISLIIVLTFIYILQNYKSSKLEQVEPSVVNDKQSLDTGISQIPVREVKGDFFAEYRMERERIRGKQLELLRSIINNEASEEKARTAASLRIVDITKEMEKEMQAESIIKSKGYKDCVIILQAEATTIIIQTHNLSVAREKELRDLVGKITETNPEKMAIIVREIE